MINIVTNMINIIINMINIVIINTSGNIGTFASVYPHFLFLSLQHI